MRGRQPRPLSLAPGDYLSRLQRSARQVSLLDFQVQRARIVLAGAAGEAVPGGAARWACDPAAAGRANEAIGGSGAGKSARTKAERAQPGRGCRGVVPGRGRFAGNWNRSSSCRTDRSRHPAGISPTRGLSSGWANRRRSMARIATAKSVNQKPSQPLRGRRPPTTRPRDPLTSYTLSIGICLSDGGCRPDGRTARSLARRRPGSWAWGAAGVGAGQGGTSMARLRSFEVELEAVTPLWIGGASAQVPQGLTERHATSWPAREAVAPIPRSRFGLVFGGSKSAAGGLRVPVETPHPTAPPTAPGPG